MKTFHVWAPTPKKVELQIGGKKFPMTAGANGWWTAEIETAGDYGFILDGEGPFPDPRSPSQPNGVHKLSRLVDQNSFQWTDKNWQAAPLSTAIFYELHIGTFTPQGTFESAIEKLDHLVELGITHVEMMPVNEFSGNHGWGYDGVQLFAPHHAYGGPDALKKFVNACHERRLAVVLDVVYNHLGPTGNYLPKFAPYFQKKISTPWGDAVNFDDEGSDEVRRFFCDNALMWLRDYHFDGLRLDAVHAIHDETAVPFLEQLAVEVKELEAQLGRHFVVIPESSLNDPRLLWPRERGGFQLDAQWNDDFHHALHSVLTCEKNGYYADFGSLADLCKALKQAYVYDGQFSVFRGRKHGRAPEGLDGHRFLGYLQTHDQIGNRAQGERSSQLLNKNQLKIGAALVLTSPFVPMLFQGEEWAASTPFLYFTDHEEAELANAVREGRRREFAGFGWKPEEIPDPQAAETFQRSKLNWPEISKSPHAEIFEWHKKLIQLRQAGPDLSDGELKNVQTNHDEQNRWLVVERGSMSIVCNFAARAQRIPIHAGEQKILIASESEICVGNGFADLPPESVVVLKR